MRVGYVPSWNSPHRVDEALLQKALGTSRLIRRISFFPE